jgi:hypothetical protein
LLVLGSTWHLLDVLAFLVKLFCISHLLLLQDKLSPLYTQIACEFADLHDRTGRMEATGVIRQVWKRHDHAMAM